MFAVLCMLLLDVKLIILTIGAQVDTHELTETNTALGVNTKLSYPGN